MTDKHSALRGAPQNAAAIGDFGSKPYSPQAIDNRQRFALLWEETKSSLRLRGWSSFKPGAMVELYVENGTSTVLKSIWLSPTKDVVRIRLNPVDIKARSTIVSALKGVSFDTGTPFTIRDVTLKRAGGTDVAVQLSVPLATFFVTCDDAEQMSGRINHVVGAVLDRIPDTGSHA
ncbi:MAG: hypothetical protein ABI625_15495 [bacterium]